MENDFVANVIYVLMIAALLAFCMAFNHHINCQQCKTTEAYNANR